MKEMRQQYFRIGGVRVKVQEYPDGAVVSIYGSMDWIHDSYEAALAALGRHAAELTLSLTEGWALAGDSNSRAKTEGCVGCCSSAPSLSIR